MFRLALCDEDISFVQWMKEQLSSELEMKGILYEIKAFYSVDELLSAENLISGLQAVFLNINMKSAGGMTAVHRIKNDYEEISIVLVTDNDCYAVEGYQMEIVRYLLKEDKNLLFLLKEALLSVLHKRGFLDLREKIRFIEGERAYHPLQIMYIESRLHRLYFHMAGETEVYTMYGKLNDWEIELKKSGFVRSHQSYLVNPVHAVGIEKREILMVNGDRLMIPKARCRVVREAFKAVK